MPICSWTNLPNLAKLGPMRKFLTILLALLCSACEQSGDSPAHHRPLTKELIVVTHNGPNTYYVDGENQNAGFEYDLVQMFIKDLGPEYSAKFLVVGNISQVIPTLVKGQAHFAAADLSITKLRQHLVKFSMPYQTTQQKVIYNESESKPPKTIADLIGKRIAVPAGTSYAERLRELKERAPALAWDEPKRASADELMEQVADGSLDFTVADSHLANMLKNYYPNLADGMSVGKPEQVAWAFPKRGQTWIYQRANAFMEKIKKDGRLRNLIDRYYGHSERLNPMDVTTFLVRTRSVLPQYVGLFKQAQEITGLDWRLLAGVSYQESHWDRFNTSPTNVRGMMMLTEDTADRLGVTDRLDARQSILGGARYIVLLRDMLPERIPEPDRTWLALAAYNIGFAHLEDARILTKRMKLNPDSWADVKKTLPLLNKAEHYSTLKYGYASGGAPVVFVESIRTYHKILERYEPKHQPVLPDFNLVNAGMTTGIAPYQPVP